MKKTAIAAAVAALALSLASCAGLQVKATYQYPAPAASK